MFSAFISYAHADEALKDRFLVHSAALCREGLIGAWHDRMLKAGQHLDSAIETELAAADLVILLISPDFIHSNYCTEKEMQRAFARAKAGTCIVVPIILEPCQWTNIPIESGGRLGDFLALPRDGRPVTEWPNQNAVFNGVVAAIRDLITDTIAPGRGPPAANAEFSPLKDTPPRQRDMTKGRSEVQGRALNLKLPRRFTDLDRDTFVDETFEAIALGFKERLTALEQENEGIKTRFQRIDAHCFIASVYAQANMVGGAKVFRGGLSHRDNSIHLSYDLSAARNGWNEWLMVEQDDARLYLKPGGMAHVLDSDDAERRKLNSNDTADYLWSVMMFQVQARIR